MKTLKVLFVLCIMLGFTVSAVCQDKGRQVVRPMKGRFYEQVVDKSNPAQVKSLITGNVTHMGNITGESILDMSKMIWVGNVISNLTNYKTKIAANGDEIYSVAYPILFLNTPFDGTGTMSAKAITIGGTGRFKDCTGEVEIVSGTFNLITGYKEYTVVGWIKY